jgi:hypothetical protein
MQTTFMNYSHSGWNVSLANRWLSNVSLKTSDNTLNAPNGGTRTTWIPASTRMTWWTSTVGKEFEFGDSNVEAYLTVNNLLDQSVSAVRIQLGTARPVLSDAGLLRRHGPVLPRSDSAPSF